MTNTMRRRAALTGLLAALLTGLAACGGGEASASADAAAAAAADAAAASAGTLALTTTRTVAVYAAARPAPAASAAPLSDASRAASQDASIALAVAQLQGDLGPFGSNALVVPPLVQSAVRSVAAAASGDTLTQWLQRYPAEPRAVVAAAETVAVSRQLWAQRDQLFEAAFLAATDLAAGAPALADWSAGQTGFADGSSATDPALAAGLAAAQPGLRFADLAFEHPDRIRLLLVDALTSALAWPAQTAFEGLFLDEGSNRYLLPMQRLRQGVLRHRGSDYVADAMSLAGGSLLVIRPDTGALKAFASVRLAPALAESLAALLGSGRASAPAGEIVLPVAALTLPHTVVDKYGGGGQAFDEVQANFKALDGGGSYLQARTPAAQLDLRVDGLRLQAASVLAFTYSPLNVNAPTYGSVFQYGNLSPVFSFPGPSDCLVREPDLRSFFLVLLDAQQGVLAMGAIRAPGGTRC